MSIVLCDCDKSEREWWMLIYSANAVMILWCFVEEVWYQIPEAFRNTICCHIFDSVILGGGR